MAVKLVIVESPAKARTLGKILGRSYSVKASLGHIRDLPKSELGVDIEKDFAPHYVTVLQKRKVIGELKRAAAKASSIYLATDLDREGEAISWHLVKAAKLDANDTPVHRVVFHEITREAIQEAFKSPRTIDMNLVNAQQARRILDRLVGYKVSPLLWKNVQRGLSAGRVQSVAVRIIVDREREIQGFTPVEFWTIEVELAAPGKKPHFKAEVVALLDGTKLDIPDETEARRITARLEKAGYRVKSARTRKVTRQPAPPFITSTLQQEASRKLHFTAKHTMMIAQQLYEGLPLGKAGSAGLITYMRTDSTHIAPSARAEAREFIAQKYGEKFVPTKARVFARKSKWAQEAHEAIRPTSVAREPEKVKLLLKPDQAKLYELIWKRFVASQMAASIYDTTNVEIEAIVRAPEDGYRLKATSSLMKFPGFMVVYSEEKDESDKKEATAPLPELKDGEKLDYLAAFPEQHFTQPPPRYTEATLIKALEQEGIGRPSTYAPILATIQERGYVHKQNGQFHPDELGTLVNDILCRHFSKIMELKFTAQMEEDLDEIARGNKNWVKVLRSFYSPFATMLEHAATNMEKVALVEVTEQKCPACGRPMVVKRGRFGNFLACSGYPECKTTMPLGGEKVALVEVTEQKCPACGRPMVIKRGRFGKFLACSGYPECKTTMPFLVKTGIPCPKCDGELVQRRGKNKRLFYGCSNYPRCKFIASKLPKKE